MLGIEQFALAHSLGSSHGETRLIRKAYFESAGYVPLLHRTYELWNQLSLESRVPLLHQSGLLIITPNSGATGIAREGVLNTAKEHQIPIEILDTKEMARRFPQFKVPEGYDGILEPGAGYLLVERCVEEASRLAALHGAEILQHHPVQSWSSDGETVTVRTENETYTAAKLVVTAGPWSTGLLRDLKLPLNVRRVPQFWFSSDESYLSGRGMPCFAFDRPGHFIYGFPNFPGVGLKIADHTPGETIGHPDLLDRTARTMDAAAIQDCIRECLPGVQPSPIASSVCMYTLTPDEHFIVDRHPVHSNVVFAAGFSGHGFKFAPVIGECLADLATEGTTNLPIGFLRRRW